MVVLVVTALPLVVLALPTPLAALAVPGVEVVMQT